MKNIILAITFLLILSCKNDETRIEFTPSLVKEINQIVKMILIEDSLGVFENSKDNAMLIDELIKLHIEIPEKSKENQLPPPPLINGAYINDLINGNDYPTFFSPLDSLHLLKQNLNPEKFKLDPKIITKVNFIKKDQQIERQLEIMSAYTKAKCNMKNWMKL